MTVECKEYLHRSAELAQFSNIFMARVRETGQLWTGEDNFVLQTPRLKITTLPDTPRVKTKAKLTVAFVNPLHQELTLGCFSIEAPGLVHPTRVNLGYHIFI
jgi:hypothetical protein